MTDSSQPKFKFKKRSKASLKNKRLRARTTDNDATLKNSGGDDDVEKAEVNVAGSSANRVEDDQHDDDGVPSAADAIPKKHAGEDEEEEEPLGTALNAILAVERRRRLLGTRNRGVDASRLGKTKNGAVDNICGATTSSNNESSSSGDAAAADANAQGTDTGRNEDLEERLRGTFAGGKLAGSNDMGGGDDGDDGGILAKKHRRAMEDFIRENLDRSGEEGGSGGAMGGGDADESSGGAQKKNTSEAESRELYAELLAGEGGAVEGDSAAAEKGGEGDVGDGGAMMGGTGIAEVALPIDDRIRSLRETERAAMEHERMRRSRYGGGGGGYGDGGVAPGAIGREGDVPRGGSTGPSSLAAMVPMNFASGPGKRKRHDDDDDNAGLVVGRDVPSSQNATIPIRGTNPPMGNTESQYPPVVESSAIPGHSASSAGTSVQRADVSTLGASYSHNFQLHTKEWVSRRRDERQVEIDAMEKQQEAEEGGASLSAEARGRMGFEMARKIARGEVVVPPVGGSAVGAGGRGLSNSGETSMRNEWDRKQGGGDQGRSNDERVWRSFMSKSRNRR